MQQSARGLACSEDCHGRMVQAYGDTALHTQLKYLEALFDLPRALNKKNLELVGFISDVAYMFNKFPLEVM